MQHLLHGARGVGSVIPVLNKAARALDTAGDALAQIAGDLATIGSITERAQVLRREVDALKLQLRRRPTGKSAKKPKRRRRAT
jgi:uncharacterized small protein (DUF1192 family)